MGLFPTIPTVKASFHQGDLILTGNNVTTIEGNFDINGSIVVTENATLVLKDAVVNLTQASSRQFNITFRTPLHGNPRLLASNSTITSGLDSVVSFEDNSTGILNNSTVSWNLFARDHSMLTVLNSSYVLWAWWEGASNITVCDSTMSSWMTYDSAQVEAYNTKIGSILIGPRSVNCTISNLKPGNLSFWNSLISFNVTVQPGGNCPNATLTSTTVNDWRFAFYGSSTAVITDSMIGEAMSLDSSVIYLIRSSINYAHPLSSAPIWAYDSSINYLEAISSRTIWLLNSTYNTLSIQDTARVYVSWYLNAHIVDSLNQSVTSANVTITYPNMTIADSKLTDVNGIVQFALVQKMINATAQFPIGNYTVEATYETYSQTSTINMTGNKEITLTLDFVVPEYTSLIILPLFMIATLLAAIMWRRKHKVRPV